MKQGQKTAASHLDDLQNCTEEFAKMKQSNLEKHGATKRHGESVPLALANKKYPSSVPLDFRQEDVKLYIPPGTSCWRGNLRAEWWGHCQPYKRVREPTRRHGGNERETILSMLRQLWEQYCRKEGVGLKQCGIPGLFSSSSGK